MSNLQADVVFLNEAHRDFLQTRNPDVLDLGTMKFSLCRQLIGGPYWYLLMSFCSAVLMGALLIPLSIAFIVTYTLEVIEHGLPEGQLTLNFFCITIVSLIGALMSISYLRQAFPDLRWNNRRISDLLLDLIDDGKLTVGQVQSAQSSDSFVYKITYRFTNDAGEELEKVFYSGGDADCEPDTSVWVLYLDDKISVLL